MFRPGVNTQGWEADVSSGSGRDRTSETKPTSALRSGGTGEFGTAGLGEDTEALNVTADEDGAIWLYFGEESVFEIAHSVYYLSFEAQLEEI